MVQVVNKAIRASGCYNCRLSLLRAFTAISSTSLQPVYQPSRGLWTSNEKQSRLFSSLTRHVSLSSDTERDIRSSLEEKQENKEDFNAQPSHNAAVPWYLQVGQSSKPAQPLSERQKIPELPESPPKILEPLLQQISVDLGLDDLSLLDLRHLDPPPALGANLLMIIGTARSEKHLHVSADRLCRWLRSEYKLRPDADGLLGRNEVKLKIRRKTRRAKLLGSGTSNDDMDDGVRTGWVCVNIGAVESPIALEKLQPPKEGFVGFGRQIEGVKIVVQMLLEEKREELDLENLWGGISRRSLAESQLMKGGAADMDGQSDAVCKHPIASEPQHSIPVNSPATFSPIFIQSRGFHTAHRRRLPALEQTSSATLPSAALFSTHGQSSYIDLSSIRRQIISLLQSGEQDAAIRLVVDNISSMAELQNDGWRKYLLDWLRSYIENIPRAQALMELGSGWGDQSSTPFLHCFYYAISRFPSESGWASHIWLHCFARKLGHTGYTLDGLAVLFSDLQLSGTTISDSMYLNFLRSTLQPHPESQGTDHSRADNAQLEFAVNILQDMNDRTGNILTEDVFLVLQESLASYPTSQSELLSQLSIHPRAAVVTYDLPILEMNFHDANSRVNMLMSTLQVRVRNDVNRMRLMILYAKQYRWVEFWRLWRSIALEGEPRSSALWALMFKLVAETKHQKGCMTVLRTWVSDMDREQPQVKLEGEVLKGVKVCLALADPTVDEEMLYDREARGEWISLWRRCLGVV